MISAPSIPSFQTYGNEVSSDDVGFVHVEKVMDRRFLHNGHVESHRHEHLCQLCLWIKGNGIYIIEDRKLTFQAPMFVYVPTQIVHGFDVTSGSDAIVISLAHDVVSQDLLFKGNMSHTPLIIGDTRPGVQPTPLMEALMVTACMRYQTSPDTSGQIVRGLAIAVLGEALSVGHTLLHHEQSTLATRIRELIELHFREAWTVADYAKILHHTPYQINQATQSAFGQTLKRLILDRKLQESKRLLAFTIRSIEAIAAEIGIPDPAYFSRFFHNECGVSPREWRRNWSKKP